MIEYPYSIIMKIKKITDRHTDGVNELGQYINKELRGEKCVCFFFDDGVVYSEMKGMNEWMMM